MTSNTNQKHTNLWFHGYNSLIWSHNHLTPSCNPSPVVAIVGCTKYCRPVSWQIGTNSRSATNFSMLCAWLRSRLFKRTSKDASYTIHSFSNVKIWIVKYRLWADYPARRHATRPLPTWFARYLRYLVQRWYPSSARNQLDAIDRIWLLAYLRACKVMSPVRSQGILTSNVLQKSEQFLSILSE